MKNRFSLTVAVSALAVATAGTVSAATLYVALNSLNPTPPYTNWATAAHIIQDAVDAAGVGDTVLVTNGVYAVGEGNGNRVAVPNSIRLESVNGPQVTTIDGGGSVRCVYLGGNALLSGFTLTNGYVNGDGGAGVYSESSGVVTNCVLTGNTADCSDGGGAFDGTLYNCTLTGNSARGWHGTDPCGGSGGGASRATLYNCILTDNSGFTRGGGAFDCTLNNCTLTGNSAHFYGGGAGGCTLYSCTLTGNRACSCSMFDNQAPPWGGGASWDSALYNCVLTGNSPGSEGTLYNCTVTGNDGGISGTAFNSIIYYNSGGNYAEGTTLNYCCTSPLPTNGVGNITGPVLFMDLSAGDFRLREDSPCIDAGTNLLGFTMMDSDVNGGIVPVAHITDPTDILGNTRFIDGNGDGTVAWDIGTYEFNSFTPPRFAVHPRQTSDGWTLNITGAPNKWARLQRSANLRDWEDVWSGFMGAEGAHQCNDGDMGQQVMFYRVVVP